MANTNKFTTQQIIKRKRGRQAIQREQQPKNPLLFLPFTYPLTLSKGTRIVKEENGENHLILANGIRLRVVFVDPKLRDRSLINGALPLPARLKIHTRFEKSFVINNVGTAFANVRFSPTNCYDVDPVLGSTSMPFFTEVMGIYRYYRTASSSISVHFGSTEVFPITAYCVPVNYDPGANTAGYQTYLSNPNSKVALLGPLTGNGTATLTHHATTDQFAGARWTGTQDPYSAQGAASPNNNWFWMIGTASPTVNFAQVCYCSAVIDIEFWAFEENAPPA